MNYPTSEQIKDILPTFLTSFLVAAFMWSVSFWNISVYALLPIQLLAGISLTLLIYEKLHLDEYLELKQLVLTALMRK